MNDTLRRILREEIDAYDESPGPTTPHLSRIHHAEVALLRLLEGD